MQLGMIGLGRMGANMVRRLIGGGHRVRRLRQVAAGGGGAGQGRADRRRLARRPRREAREAARRLADGAGGGRGRDHRRPRCRCSSRATSSSTAAIPTTSTTSAAPKELRREGHPLRRRRHQRRRLGPGARLLHDDRRRGGRRAAPRSDLQRRWRPASGDIPRTPGREKARRHRRAGLPALRAERRRPLRQDGPQRHRVRPHGRLRRRARTSCAHANVGKQSTRGRRRDDAAARSRALPVRPQPAPTSPRSGGAAASIASWLLDLTASALLEDPGPGGVRGPGLRLGRGALDDQGRHRRGGAGAGAHHRALRALQLARRGGFPGQAALGDALRVRRAPARSRRSEEDDMSDASFGRAGLLRRHRRPRLQEDLPGAAGDGQARPPRRAVIGVAKAGWNLDQLRARARDSLEKHGGLDAAAFDEAVRPAALRRRRLRDPATFQALRQELGAAAAAGALPGHPARAVRDGRGAARPSRAAPTGARVVVEKPFGRDLASAQALNRILLGTFDETAIFRIDHYLGQAAGAEPALLPLRQRLPRADLEPQLRRERADHHGRELRRPGPRRVLRRGRRHPRRGPEPPVPGRWPTWRWSRRRGPTASRSATRRSRC